MGIKKNKFKIQNGRFRKSFSTLPKAEQFPPKFHGLVLGLVGLIDAKGINMTQPILGSAIKNLGLFSKRHGDFKMETMDF